MKEKFSDSYGWWEGVVDGGRGGVGEMKGKYFVIHKEDHNK